MSIRDAIKRLIEERGYKSPRQFAIAKGVSYVYLNAILNGRRLNEDTLEKIAQALGVPIFQLFSDEPLAPYRNIREEHTAYLTARDETENIKVFADSACLGPGYDMDSCVPAGLMPLPKKDLPRGFKSQEDRIICLPTKGTSMIPTIMPGSYIWIDRDVPTEAVVQRSIYAFLLHDGTVTIKRLIRVTNNSIIIDADNMDPSERSENGTLKDFPMVLPLCEDHSVIRGRVIWILNRLIEEPKK